MASPMNPAPLMDIMYYVYLLRGKENNKLYVSCTSNLDKRMREHNDGVNYYTKRMLPLELIYFEAYRSKQDAYRREKRLKYHGSAFRNLKLEETLCNSSFHKKGGAG